MFDGCRAALVAHCNRLAGESGHIVLDKSSHADDACLNGANDAFDGAEVSLHGAKVAICGAKRAICGAKGAICGAKIAICGAKVMPHKTCQGHM